MLEGLIRSKTTRKLLTLLITNPDERFYMRQLERLIKEPVSAVRRELMRLEESGLLLSKDEARVKYYWINRSCPIFDEVRKIILKTQGLGDNLRSLIKKIPDIIAAFIYGSVAKGDDSATSDIDLMIIGDIEAVKLHSKINEIEKKINRAINYNLISEKDFKNKKTLFIERVLKDKKIFLIGQEDELKRLS